MKFREISRPQSASRFVTPVARRGMEVIASLIDGWASHADTLGTGSMALPEAQLVVHATGCLWPLLCPEAQDLAVLTGFDAVVVRTVPGPVIGTYLSSVDLLLHEYPKWLAGYRPWIGDAHNQVWLVPSLDGPAVRMSRNGLRLTEEQPFDSDLQRDAGFRRASWIFAYWHWRG